MDPRRHPRHAPADSPATEVNLRLRAYHLLFSHPAAAEELISEFMAKDWADQLDMSTLRLFPPGDLAGKLNVRPSDCVWRVSFKEGGASVIFVFLFQDTVDPDMPLRTMQYVTDVWHLTRANPHLCDPDGSVPRVQTCLVNIGERPWDAPLTMEDWARAQWPPYDPESNAPPKLPIEHAVLYRPPDVSPS